MSSHEEWPPEMLPAFRRCCAFLSLVFWRQWASGAGCCQRGLLGLRNRGEARRSSGSVHSVAANSLATTTVGNPRLLLARSYPPRKAQDFVPTAFLAPESARSLIANRHAFNDIGHSHDRRSHLQRQAMHGRDCGYAASPMAYSDGLAIALYVRVFAGLIRRDLRFQGPFPRSAGTPIKPHILENQHE